MTRMFALFLLLVSLAACGDPPTVAEDPTSMPAITSTTEPTTTTAPTATVEPSQTSEPTVTSEPTKKPTTTRIPTRTPRPTAEPTATLEPTIEPTEETPIVFAGEGSDVTDPTIIPGTIYRISFTHNGERNFIVKAYGQDDKEETLVNAIGAYEGVRMLVGDDQEWYFEVKADGRWTMIFDRMKFITDGTWEASGKGDYVTNLFSPSKQGPVPFVFKHDGTRNFIVQLVCSEGQDTVQNEIGPVDAAAVARVQGDRCLWDVRADGSWSITPR